MFRTVRVIPVPALCRPFLTRINSFSNRTRFCWILRGCRVISSLDRRSISTRPGTRPDEDRRFWTVNHAHRARTQEMVEPYQTAGLWNSFHKERMNLPPPCPSGEIHPTLKGLPDHTGFCWILCGCRVVSSLNRRSMSTRPGTRPDEDRRFWTLKGAHPRTLGADSSRHCSGLALDYQGGKESAAICF